MGFNSGFKGLSVTVQNLVARDSFTR